MAKTLLETGASDEEIYEAKIKLAEELKDYDKVKNNEQIKALVDFLEYLFLIQKPELEKKYEEYKKIKGGAFRMTIEEIRRLHYKEQGREEGKKEIAKKLLQKGIPVEIVVESTELTLEEIEEIKRQIDD